MQLAISQAAESGLRLAGRDCGKQESKATSLLRKTKLLSTGHFIPAMHAPIFMQNARTRG